MTISRYDRDSLANNGRSFGSSQSIVLIRKAIRMNKISLKETISAENERLDIIAGQQYQDASLWWVIAAASNIGWGLQIPAGTRLRIPTDISQIMEIIS